MDTDRLEAFSDGVIAILITIMVLELRVPHSTDPAALAALYPTFLSYVLSFIYLGIYWNNHHHLFQVTKRIDGAVMWANLHLLFWLSLVSFTTAWMGENHFAALPTALYGANLLAAAIAFWILQQRILKLEGPNSKLAVAVGRDFKGKVSPLIYLIAIPLAFVNQYIAGALYAATALMWLIPDRRIERQITQ